LLGQSKFSLVFLACCLSYLNERGNIIGALSIDDKVWLGHDRIGIATANISRQLENTVWDGLSKQLEQHIPLLLLLSPLSPRAYGQANEPLSLF